MAIINATLIVQAFHFYIAYLIIKHIIFRPTLDEIKKEDSFQESLIVMIQKHQLSISQKEQQLIEHWQRVRNYFAQNIPLLKEEPYVSFEKKSKIIITRFEKNELEREASTISDQLIKKVDHVR
jgi:hypothetical protein